MTPQNYFNFHGHDFTSFDSGKVGILNGGRLFKDMLPPQHSFPLLLFLLSDAPEMWYPQEGIETLDQERYKRFGLQYKVTIYSVPNTPCWQSTLTLQTIASGEIVYSGKMPVNDIQLDWLFNLLTGNQNTNNE